MWLRIPNKQQIGLSLIKQTCLNKIENLQSKQVWVWTVFLQNEMKCFQRRKVLLHAKLNL